MNNETYERKRLQQKKRTQRGKETVLDKLKHALVPIDTEDNEAEQKKQN
jgi:hypothetical protein